MYKAMSTDELFVLYRDLKYKYTMAETPRERAALRGQCSRVWKEMCSRVTVVIDLRPKQLVQGIRPLTERN